jgi:lipoprotein NlpI
MRGGAYEKQGNRSLAAEDFRRALAIDPSLQTVKAALNRVGLQPMKEVSVPNARQ